MASPIARIPETGSRLNTGRLPRSVKQYADLHDVLLDAARTYPAEVKDGTFPGPEHSF